MATPPTRGQASGAVEAVANRLTKRAVLTARYDAGLSRQVLKLLIELEADLRGQIVKINPSGSLTPSGKQRRLETLLADTRKSIRSTYRRINNLTTRELTELMDIEARATSTIVSDSLAHVGYTLQAHLPTETYLANLASEQIVVGQPLAAWWEKQALDLQGVIHSEIRLGLAAGETVDQMAARISPEAFSQRLPTKISAEVDNELWDRRGAMLKARRGARTLVITAANSAGNKAREAVYDSNADIVTELVHLSRLDSRTSEICIARAGKRWDRSTRKPIGHDLPYANPPLHPRCLPGHCVVTPGGEISGASKRWMDGELAVIRTAAGRELPATPNHPVLTDRGWVPAGLVRVGDNVVSIGRSQGALRSVGYDEDVKAQIHELAEAALCSGEMATVPVPVAAPYFHGDGADSEVAYVAVKRDLLAEGQVALDQHETEATFGVGNVVGFSSADGDSASLFVADRAAARSCMSGLDHSGPGCSVGVGPASAHLRAEGGALLGLRPSNLGSSFAGSDNTSVAEEPIDGTWRDAEALREIAGGSSGEVTFDQVVAVRRIPFSGHVYNLETSTGWYVAEGIVTHNCRSVLVPRIVGGDLPTEQSGEEFFASLSKDEQDAVFGKGKAALFRRGEIKASDLVDQSGRPISLKRLREEKG